MPDLAKARRSVYVFGDVAGCPLTGWQARGLTLTTRITAIVAPRQSGKSRSLAVKAAQWAFRRPKQHVLIVSAGEDAARRLLAQVRRIVCDSPLLAGSVVDEMAGLITLSNGSVIRSVPASERQIRGWTVDLLLVDEAALVSDDLLLGAAMPTTAAREGARVVLASSATVASGAFYDHVRLAESGSEHVALHRWSLADCNWISASVIEAARESMSEMRFKAEYEGVFASGADALFTRQALEGATRDYAVESVSELAGPARVLAGVDWGATVDHSALCALGRFHGTQVFGVRCAHRWRAGTPLHDVIEQVASSPAHFDTLAMETNGLGMPCTQDLARRITARDGSAGGGRPTRAVVDVDDFERWVERRSREQLRRALSPAPQAFVTRKLPVHTSAELKAATYSALRLLIDRQQLLLPASAADLLRELLMLRVDLSASGERIEASTGHDDLADALMLALCPYRDESGRWRTVLGRLTAHTQPAPLDVPRAPAWQSVRGSQVTTTGSEPVPVSERDRAVRERLRQALVVSEAKGER